MEAALAKNSTGARSNVDSKDTPRSRSCSKPAEGKEASKFPLHISCRTAPPKKILPLPNRELPKTSTVSFRIDLAERQALCKENHAAQPLRKTPAHYFSNLAEVVTKAYKSKGPAFLPKARTLVTTVPASCDTPSQLMHGTLAERQGIHSGKAMCS
ncbi:hypothetical protein L3X38_042168 [Prunus dulcis]|uniref:Uncharacterized protein n=1 Tax=Prunus dulcis TaxID=3755 RepID=A0AAD4UVS3_PRUDU|nr:hypothetical protein L3X38_042168 [Prunus dulcis]